ncbi:unnamed protein product [Aphanomyces euteiches]
MGRQAHGLLRQIRTLMWKNRLLKQRHWIATTFEIIIPTLMVVFFALFKSQQPNVSIPSGFVEGTTSDNLFMMMPNTLGTDIGTPLYTSPRYGFTEVSMTGLLMALPYQAFDDFQQNSTNSLAASDEIICKTKLLSLGYTSTDVSSPFAVPVECRGLVIPYKLAIVPKNTFTVNYFSAVMAAWYPKVPLTSQPSPQFNATPIVPSWNDSLLFFDTADALQTYVAAGSYGADLSHPKIYAAIVFDKFPADDQIGTATPIEYTLRISSTQRERGAVGDVPKTDDNSPKFVEPLQKNINRNNYNAYVRRGTNTLQTLVTRFLACRPQWNSATKTTDATCQQPKSIAKPTASNVQRLTNQLLQDDVLSYILTQVGASPQLGFGLNASALVQQLPASSSQAILRPLMQAPQAFAGATTYPFPIQQYISAPFYSLVSQVFSLVFILAYLHAVSKVIVVLVREKETKSRELMKILGVRESAIVLSWYMTYIMIFVLSSVVAGIAGKLLFPNTSAGYMIIMFFLFSMTILSYGFLVSAIFSNSKTAATVGNSVFFIMYFIGNSASNSMESGKMLASLLSPVAFSFCIQTLANVEGVSTGLTAENANSAYSNYRFQGGLGMMVFDAILYSLLALYLQEVIPQEYGTPKKWYFPLQPSFWLGGSRADAKVVDKVAEAAPETINVESVGVELQAQEQDGRALRIRGIRKTFQTPMGVTKVAVNGVDLTMYQDQITCLLGHNGAGKTTLMSILTGMIPATSGNAFFGGHSIMTEMDKIRLSLGMCPQHDVLYADMTVEEHLKFYAMIKGKNY